MARAKVPKVKERWAPNTYLHISYHGRGRCTLHDAANVRTSFGGFSSIAFCRRVCRAMNLLAAVERGELIVKEAE